MLALYDNCDNLKKEISDFIELLNRNIELPLEHYIRNITKNILFLKSFVMINKRHYGNFMIYDLLMLMNSFTKNSKRNYYFVYRSFIENFMRVVLELSDDDSRGVREIIRMVEEKFSGINESKEIINYLLGEYSYACDFVHSNIKADVDVLEYYLDILEMDEMNTGETKKLIERTMTMTQKCKRFVTVNFSEDINNLFYRRNQELKYLIGENSYKYIKEQEY